MPTPLPIGPSFLTVRPRIASTCHLPQGGQLPGLVRDDHSFDMRSRSSLTSLGQTARAPRWATCCLSGVLLKDPVLAPDGRSYERAHLLDYLQSHNWVLPISGGIPIEEVDIWTDRSLSEALSSFQKPRSVGAEFDEHLMCCIGMDVMKDPVVASDGRVYELKTIQKIFRERQGLSPFGNCALAPYVYRQRSIATSAREMGYDVVDVSLPSLVELLPSSVEVREVVGSGEVGDQLSWEDDWSDLADEYRGLLAAEMGIWLCVTGFCLTLSVLSGGLLLPLIGLWAIVPIGVCALMASVGCWKLVRSLNRARVVDDSQA